MTVGGSAYDVNMPFAHDTVSSLRAAVDLVNSGEEPDTLRTVAHVDAWYAEHGYTGRRDGDEAELATLRALRPVLRELLTAGRDRAAELVNAMLADAGALPQLVRHDGLDWHIHAVPADAPLDRRVVVESAKDAAETIANASPARISAPGALSSAIRPMTDDSRAWRVSFQHALRP